MKVLIISHNPLSAQNNMGKTFLSLFSCFSREELCQLYIYPSLPDGDWCNGFYRVTDKEILKSYLNFSKPGGVLHPDQIGQSVGQYENPEDQPLYKNRKNKSALRRLLRDAMWRFSTWDNRQLQAWLDKEQPNCIFVAPGVAKFTYDFALRISRKRNIPIVTYICDEYYFVKKPGAVLDRIRLKLLQKKMEQLMKTSDHLVVISRELEQIYGDRFHVPVTTLMTGTELGFRNGIKVNPAPRNLCYFGNIRCNRYINLAQIGRELDRLNTESGSDYRLKIYTAEKDPQILGTLAEIQSIEFCGFVSGVAFEKAMLDADILLHTEAFDEASIDFTQHSISTKIADSLASGTPMLAYGPACISSMKYLMENSCAVVATSPEKLPETLLQVFTKENLRTEAAQNGLGTAKRYHDPSVNSQKLKELIMGCIR